MPVETPIFETCFSASDTTLSSPSQRVREMSEKWAARNLRCPECSRNLTRATANLPSLDLLCESCGLQFELKAKKLGPRRGITRSISGGSYERTVSRTGAPDSPSLFLIEYDAMSLEVIRVLLYPRQFFVSSILTRRNPLAATAKRPFWVGCIIQLHLIPALGRIMVLENGHLMLERSLRDAWRASRFLDEIGDARGRGWLVDVLRVVQGLPVEFSLADVYARSAELAALHPENRHVKAKVRQQLQVLRDNEQLIFLGRGRYRTLA